MEIRETEVCREKGFTIVELLTVMSVIAILIALLVPALGLVKDYSKEVEQQAQFHSIEVGLELYKTEFGSYPESDDNAYDTTLSAQTPYCGANKLAEALVGWDLLGFHPKSEFIETGNDDGGIAVYDNTSANISERKGPFIEFENANVFDMADIYSDIIAADFDDTERNNVLCDVFDKRRISGKKTGMPILYFKARTMYTEQDSRVTTGTGHGTEDDIYYYPDNFNLVDLGDPETSNAHPLADGGAGAVVPAPAAGSGAFDNDEDCEDFDSMIVNTQVTTIRRPYRSGTYILVSAGKDGLYGTPDDLFNFKKKE